MRTAKAEKQEESARKNLPQSKNGATVYETNEKQRHLETGKGKA